MRRFKRIISAILVLCLCFAGMNFAFASDDDNWWNILLLGCDSYSDGNYTRTDSMIILSINRETSAVKMTSIMRDTWIEDPVTGVHRKLTELCAVGNGPARTIEAINKNFGMNIEKYVLVSMEAIANLIDLLGGVDIEITEAERKAINKGLFNLSSYSGMETVDESGLVHLNGNQATAYARIRKIDTDYKRTERQREVLLKMAAIMKDNLTATNLFSVIQNLMVYVDTNMTLTDIMEVGAIAMKCDLSSVEQFRIPADGTYKDGMYGSTWCIRPNFEKNTELLHEFIYGSGEQQTEEQSEEQN